MPEANGAKNAYHCEVCLQYIVTVNLAEGVTPMFLSCRATDGCKGRMTSCMYPPEPWPKKDGFDVAIPQEPTHVWYRPVSPEYDDLNRETKIHVRKGGLLLRPVKASA